MLINNIYLFIFVVYLKFYRTSASRNNIDEFLTATFATSSFYVTSSFYLLKNFITGSHVLLLQLNTEDILRQKEAW